MNSAGQLWRRPIVHAALVALLVGSVTWLLAMQRPTEYEARLDLLASPRQDGDAATSSNFPAVASQMLPAIVDAAHSPAVLAKASDAAEGTPSAAELGHLVVVDVVPASLLTRLSVRAPSPEMARQLVVTIAAEVVASDLIAPVGDLRAVDGEPSVVKVAPDGLLAAGLALAAGAAAAVAVLVLDALIRPARRQRVMRALAVVGVSRPVAIVDCRQADAAAQLTVLSVASARPVRVVALTPSAASSVAALSAELASAGVPVAGCGADEEVAVVGLVSEVFVDRLAGAIAALPEHARLIAVALTASRHRKRRAGEAGPDA